LSTTELVDAIRKAARGEAVMHPRVAERILQGIDDERRPTESADPTALSRRELDVLRLIAGGRNNSQIAESLVISEHTVKSHVSNILSKLHLVDRTQAAAFAWREGLIDRSQP